MLNQNFMLVWFVKLNEPKQFWSSFIEGYFNETIWKPQNKAFVENCCMWGYNFDMTIAPKKAATEKIHLEFPLALNILNHLSVKCCGISR